MTENPKLSTIVTENPKFSTIITESPEVSTIVPENPEFSTLVTENLQASTIVTENAEVSTIITGNPKLSTIITDNPKLFTIVTENPKDSSTASVSPVVPTKITEEVTEQYKLIVSSEIKYNNSCLYYFYIDENNYKILCTYNFSCPDDYNILIEEKNECVKNCTKDPQYKYEMDKKCYIDCPNNSFKTRRYKCLKLNFDEFTNKTELFEYIKNIIFNELDISDVNQGIDLEIFTDSFLMSLTNNYNQRKNFEENNNKTSINLTQCENRLRSVNGIPSNVSIYIIKIEVEEKGMKIPKIEYELFHYSNTGEIIKLNLKECENLKADIIIPVNITDVNHIEKHNSSSDYYNNICSKTKSEKGTDISLNDRKNIFMDNNLTLCEEDCTLEEYNKTTGKARCSCLVKIKFPLIEEIKFDKKKLYKSFTDINNIANVQFLKCYKEAFKIKSLIKNLGFYIFIFLLCLHFISLLLFYCRYFSILINDIQLIIDAKINLFNLSKKNNKEKIKKVIKTINNNQKNIINKINTEINPSFSNSQKKIMELNENSKINKRFSKLKKKLNKQKNNLKTSYSRKQNKALNSDNKITSNAKNDITRVNLGKKNTNNLSYKLYKEIMKYNETELNSLSYEQALINDRRTFSEYYISLLKINHSLIFSFYCKNRDYNSQVIKIFLFFFFFSAHLTVNAIFFSDGTMHKIYIDEGKFNFIYQISQIIYSSLISAAIDMLVKFLSLTEKSVLEIKGEKEINNLDNKFKKLICNLKIKFGLFFGITFIILLVFMYYITCFCGIYEHTQIHLISDSIISFGLSFIYPFGIYLLPSMFRILALRAEKKNKTCVYKFSQFLENF